MTVILSLIFALKISIHETIKAHDWINTIIIISEMLNETENTNMSNILKFLNIFIATTNLITKRSYEFYTCYLIILIFQKLIRILHFYKMLTKKTKKDKPKRIKNFHMCNINTTRILQKQTNIKETLCNLLNIQSDEIPSKSCNCACTCTSHICTTKINLITKNQIKISELIENLTTTMD